MNDLVQVSLAACSSQSNKLGNVLSASQEKKGYQQLLFNTFTFYLLASNCINFYVLIVHFV